MEHEILEHRKRLDILQKHLKTNYYNVGQYHQALSDAMKEYAEQSNIVDTGSDTKSSLTNIFKLECLTEDGNIETNGYYKTRESAELKKSELDNYPMNLKYGIKQQIVEIDLED